MFVVSPDTSYLNDPESRTGRVVMSFSPGISQGRPPLWVVPKVPDTHLPRHDVTPVFRDQSRSPMGFIYSGPRIRGAERWSRVSELRARRIDLRARPDRPPSYQEPESFLTEPTVTSTYPTSVRTEIPHLVGSVDIPVSPNPVSVLFRPSPRGCPRVQRQGHPTLNVDL